MPYLDSADMICAFGGLGYQVCTALLFNWASLIELQARQQLLVRSPELVSREHYGYFTAYILATAAGAGSYATARWYALRPSRFRNRATPVP